eukprot:TRINITY_DN22152_c0_g1_i1.p1 TRINITY_DN22152_c0_g1~~TRINITY_DN22152_c0_g1_i1.p1  ORF type:complete len:625 (+),score=82.21 TRINITY_DN22152_c0_g1_i1:490-2364(+)
MSKMPPARTPPRLPSVASQGAAVPPKSYSATHFSYTPDEMSRLHLEYDDRNFASSTPVAAAPLVRTFDVLLMGPEGRRWYERGVSCSRASDLCGILQSRLGFPISEVLYQGAVFTENHFRTVPNELKLELAQGSQPPQAGNANTFLNGVASKREVTLLVEETPTRMTFDVYSVNDLMQKLTDAGLAGDVYMRNITRTGEEVLQPVTNLESIKPDQPLRVVRREGTRGFSAAPSPRAYSRSNGRETPRTPLQPPEREPVSVQHIVVETGNLLLQSPLMSHADDQAIAKATAAIAQQFKHMYTTTSAPHAGRRPNEEEVVYLQRLVSDYLAPLGQRRPSVPSASSTPAAHATGTGATNNSVFKSVTFGVSGAFPVQPAQSLVNAISVAPPQQPEEGKSVVVIVHANTPTDLDLRCTLGYENEHGRILVINMDEFYMNEWVSIGKTSPTSLFISFLPDVLRAGVRYLLDVTAFNADQPGVKVGNAQVEVVIQPANAVHPPARAEATLPSTVPASDTRAVPRTEHRAHAPAEPSYPPVPAAAPSAPRSSQENSQLEDEGYFQGQVRAFLENKVLPLYSLSSNPRFTEDAFIDMVEEACADFWELDPDQELSEAHKKTILGRVKEVLLR